MLIPVPVSYEVFSGELSPGERVEWSGQPNPAVIFHPSDASMIPFSLLWGGFAVVWFLAAAGIWNPTSFRYHARIQGAGLIWGGVFVVVGQYMIWGRFLYDRWKKPRTFYALTNRRALIIGHGITGRKVTSVYFEKLALIDKRVRRDGIGSVAFGGAVRDAWQMGKRRKPRPPTFDDVDEAESVYQHAERLRTGPETTVFGD